ncbi:MAG: hypothetical protein A2516_02885, partial [Alphaproteobacteria bacterium RIFOXYD12_FULL_60_8]
MGVGFDASKVEEKWLEARLTREILDTLDDKQKMAIGKAMRKAAWEAHPVDMRLTIPFFKTRYFLTILGGKDARNKERTQIEKAAHPVRKPGNIVFAFGASAAFTLLFVIASLIYSGVIVPSLAAVPFATIYVGTFALVCTLVFGLVAYAMAERKAREGTPYN